RVMRKKPFLHTRHKHARLRYAKAHLNKPDSFWNKVIWTDETKIELLGHNKRRYAWRQKNTAFQKKHLLPIVKFGGGSSCCGAVWLVTVLGIFLNLRTGC